MPSVAHLPRCERARLAAVVVRGFAPVVAPDPPVVALPLVERLRIAAKHPTVHLGVTIATGTLACPRCSHGDVRPAQDADLRGFSAMQCRRCSFAFRVVVATGAEILAALTGPVAAPAPEPEDGDPDVWATAAERAEIERDLREQAEARLPPDDEDRALAAEVLQAWRVRLAAIRSRKRMDDDAPPLDEDLALLERVAAG